MPPSSSLHNPYSSSRASLASASSIPQTLLSPLSSPGRSPTQPAEYFAPSSRVEKKTSKEEAFKVVKHLEEVLATWNEYRLTLTAAGKAGKKLAGAMKDLVGCMDNTEVPAQTIRPSAQMIDTTADTLIKLSKKVDSAYDRANTDASKYFNLLAKESRSHEAYLGAVSSRLDKAEKAYRKVSKTIGDSAMAHSGLVALKTSLSDDIARANMDQAKLLGSKQATLLLRMASSIGLIANATTVYFSDGLRKAGAVYPDMEYFRALADIQWQGALPTDSNEKEETRRRDETRLWKTRVALGEMDTVGQKVWDELGDSGQLTPMSNRSVSSTHTISPIKQRIAGPTSEAMSNSSGGSTLYDKISGNGHSQSNTPTSHLSASTAHTSSPASSHHSAQSNMVGGVSPFGGTKPLFQSPSARPMGIRPQQIRHVSVASGLTQLPRPITIPISPLRRSVSEIAAEMESLASTSRQNAFEAHQTHGSFGSFVDGCGLCGIDYDRMMKGRLYSNNRRVTMPPIHSVQETDSRSRSCQKSPDGLNEETSSGGQSLPSGSHIPGKVFSPTPRRAIGTGPEFALA